MIAKRRCALCLCRFPRPLAYSPKGIWGACWDCTANRFLDMVRALVAVSNDGPWILPRRLPQGITAESTLTQYDQLNVQIRERLSQ